MRAWAAVDRTRTPLLRIPKSMSAMAFAKFMREKAGPALIDVAGDPSRLWRLVQDGDGTHSAKITLKTLREMGVRVVDPWPSHSISISSRTYGRCLGMLWSVTTRRPNSDYGVRCKWRGTRFRKAKSTIASHPCLDDSTPSSRLAAAPRVTDGAS